MRRKALLKATEEEREDNRDRDLENSSEVLYCEGGQEKRKTNDTEGKEEIVGRRSLKI